MDGHKITHDVAKEAATAAAVKFDEQVYALMKANGLEKLFTKAIDAMDPSALEREGYKLIVETEHKEIEVAEHSEITKRETIYTIKLAKIIDEQSFSLKAVVDYSGMKMRTPNA